MDQERSAVRSGTYLCYSLALTMKGVLKDLNIWYIPLLQSGMDHERSAERSEYLVHTFVPRRVGLGVGWGLSAPVSKLSC